MKSSASEVAPVVIEDTISPELKIAGKTEKAECHFVKGYNDAKLSPEYTHPATHIKLIKC